MRKGNTVQQKDTEWSVLETTKSRIPSSDEEEKEIAKNRTNIECRRAR